MRKLTLIVFVALVTAIAAAGFAEEEKGLVPKFPILGGNLKATGFVQGTLTSSRLDGQDTDIPNARVQAEYDRGDWGGGSVISFVDLEPDGNWLRELWVKHSLTDRLQIRFGRLFIASGNSTPSPYNLETVEYPLADVFDQYAWGAQIRYESDDWAAAFDITGKPGVSFQSEENWDTPACSGRLKLKFDSGSWVAGTFQFSEDFFRLGLDGTWKPDSSLTFRGEVCYEQQSSDRASDQVGMYLFGGYRPLKNWEVVHLQMDFRQYLSKSWTETQTSIDRKTGDVSIKTVEMSSMDAHDAVFTVGTRVFWGKDDALSLRADLQIPLDDSQALDDARLQVLVQLKF
ncbi:MAG: hypothetical protein WC516_03740 [Patescibacteria group bacterium]